MYEVELPARIRPRLDRNGRPSSDRAVAGSALSHRQPFLAIEAVDAVLADPLTLLPQQNEQPPIAEAPALIGEVSQSGAQRRVARPLRNIADRLTVDGDDVTGPTLRQAHDGPKVRDGFALGERRTDAREGIDHQRYQAAVAAQ